MATTTFSLGLATSNCQNRCGSATQRCHHIFGERLQNLVDKVGNKLVQNSVASETPYRYEFHLLADDRTINAFALPGGPIFITYALFKQLNEAVAALLDETAGLGYMGANSEDVKLVGEDLTSELLGFAFPEGSPLVDVINQGLAAMTESGKLNEINSAYFNPDFTLDYDGIAEDVGEASEATGTGPCSEATISTGSNGLPDLGGCNMIIAVENAYIPFNYIDLADGKAKGWDYDVFNELSNLLNFVPVYTPASWDGMIQAVADGQFDIAGDGITITDERDKIIDFSDGYINIAQRIMVSTDSDISSLQDLLDYINN